MSALELIFPSRGAGGGPVRHGAARRPDRGRLSAGAARLRPGRASGRRAGDGCHGSAAGAACRGPGEALRDENAVMHFPLRK